MSSQRPPVAAKTFASAEAIKTGKKAAIADIRAAPTPRRSACAQGFVLLSRSVALLGYGVQSGEMAHLERRCIIRAVFLDRIRQAFDATRTFQPARPTSKAIKTRADLAEDRPPRRQARGGPAMSASLAYFGLRPRARPRT
jgi:6-phosphogluconate dehydrogenase